MSFKDNVLSWLSSGGAYILIAILWIICVIVFGAKAREVSKADGNSNSGCFLIISTTVFVATGGAIGLYLFKDFFPWFILTSLVGAILGPTLAIRKFKSGKRRY